MANYNEIDMIAVGKAEAVRVKAQTERTWKDIEDDNESLMLQDARKRDSIIRGLANDIIGAAGQTADYNAEMIDFSVSFRSAGTMITAKYRKSVYLKTR
jgi:hypothetical protein